MDCKSIILYGAGQNAELHYPEWVKNGINAVCFADCDVEKHNTALHGLEVLSLLDAIARYPDYMLYCTQAAYKYDSVRSFLLGVGIPDNRIRLLLCSDIPFNRSELQQRRSPAKYALAQYSVLLCDSFSCFIEELIEVEKHKRFKPEMLANELFQCFQLFLSQQASIQRVYDRLDEISRKTWYYILYLWTVTQLFLDNPEDIHYSRSKRYDDFSLIQGIVSGVFDLESNAETSSLREQYILCDGFMSKGDCVIDAGAYTGDTAELFSEIVGETGKVFSFEPFKDSFGKLEQRMLPNVRCINRGLYSSETELEISVNDNEPAGNSVTYTQYANKPDRVYVTTIDKFVKENEISKIDFIKMDVEGSELFALRGGYETIRRFRPNMAICIYHNYGKDAFNVPVYLVEEFGDLYEFSVKHHSIGWYETVMYAIRK